MASSNDMQGLWQWEAMVTSDDRWGSNNKLDNNENEEQQVTKHVATNAK